MSKIIKLTDEHRDEIRREFDVALAGAKLSDGKISYTKTFGSITRKATLFFSELAYLKMMTLVREFDKEVAWHGLAKRGDDESKDEYVVYDILVYPQEVTGATVNTDQEKYQMWLMNHDDDVFNNIRMQGHSHVNMGTTPSTVDTTLYEQILDQLEDDMFYIFLIWNKKNEKTIKIYDLAKNVLFETSDVTVSVLEDGTGVESFVKAAKEMVQDKKYTTPSTGGTQYGGYGGYSSYGGYGNYGRPYGYGGYYGASEQKSGSSNVTKLPSATETGKKSETTGTQQSQGGSGKKKRKKKKHGGFQNACDDDQTSLWLRDEYGDDDDDDPYGYFERYGWHQT